MRTPWIPSSEYTHQQVPSSSQARSGSMPGTPTGTGSDQGPAGSLAVTRTVPAPVTTVVIIQKRPSWCLRVGAYTPHEAGTVSGSSNWPGRSSACPISRQCTRSRLCHRGTPGTYSKLDVAT